MKLSLLLFCMISITLTAPLYSYGSQENGERNVQDYDSVLFKTGGTLIIEQGDREYLRIEAPRKVLERMTTEVRQHKLHIGYRGIFTFGNINPVIYLGIKDIRELSVSSSGSIEIQNINTDYIEIKTSSSGSINIGNLKADDMKLKISSSGNINIESSTSTSIDSFISSSGDLLISGNTEDLVLRCSSSGDFKGDTFRAVNAEVRLSSSGSAILEVKNNIEARLSSSGVLSYYGEPTVDVSSKDDRDKLRALGIRK